MSEGTARNKLPSTAGASIPQLRQPPPMQHRAPASIKVASTGGFALKPEDDKTTAYKVPEELLRRARNGFVPTNLDEDKSPDSGAITAPPPVGAQERVPQVAPRAPGVPHDLLMSLLRAERDGEEEEEVTILRPSTAHLDGLDETELANAWGGDREVEIPLITRNSNHISRAPVAANDSSGRVVRKRARSAKPGVAPVLLWFAVAALAGAVATLAWLLRWVP